MKVLRKIITIGLSLTLALGVAGCGANSSKNDKNKEKEILVGVCPGPYGDMVKDAIAPYLEKKGYKVEIKEFSDYIQPDKALNNKEIDANLFQHTVYLKKFSADNKLDISAIISVPTVGMGIFSKSVKSLNDLKNKAKVSIPNDPSNLARALTLLSNNGVIKVNPDIQPTKATVNDIIENPKNLEFVQVEAAQLARSLESVDISVITGNFAIASGLDFKNALALEKLSEDYKNVVAVRTEDLESTLGKDLKEAVESKDFRNAIEKGKYKDFNKPDWYVNANNN